MPESGWRLPPLNALRAFAAAGRHQSFSAAAQELFVTVGAISRQIKLLEEHVGTSLFVRANHDVLLTGAGRSYHTIICALLNRIEAGSSRLAGSALEKTLNILCPTALLLQWLAPKLQAYHLKHPEQQLRINTTLSPLYNLPNRADIDISFQLARGPTPGWICHRVLSGRLALVCSPALISPRQNVDSLHGLLKHPILVSSLRAMTGPDAWNLFANGLDAEDLAQVRRIEFPSMGPAVEAAMACQGIAMVPAALVREQVASGRLVMLLNRTADTGHSYYMIHSAAANRDLRVAHFRDWLLQAAAEEKPQ